MRHDFQKSNDKRSNGSFSCDYGGTGDEQISHGGMEVIRVIRETDKAELWGNERKKVEKLKITEIDKN